MERLYPDKKYYFNENIDDWKRIAKDTLDEEEGKLYLIDADTNEEIEAEILFLYSTLIYTGYYCRGIAKISDKIGTVFVGLFVDSNQVLFKEDKCLLESSYFDETVQNIVEDLRDDCWNTEAIHVGKRKKRI